MSTQTTSSAHHRNVARRSDICIVGNGAIAKTAALGLSQAGYSVTLLVPPARPDGPEAAAGAEQPWDVRVYALSPGNVDFLRSVDAWEVVLPRAAPVHASGMPQTAAR